MISGKPVLILSLILFVSTLLFNLPLFGEDSVASGTADNKDGSSSTVENSPFLPSDEPIPYSPDEFPEFIKGMRRFDVIFFGTIPFAFMFTTLIYDFSLYAYHDFNRNYGFGTARSEDDLIVLGVITLSVSAVVAIIDIIIYSIKRNQALSLEAAREDVP